MRSALCVTMLAVCFFALQCTADNEVPDGQEGDQRSGVPSTDAVTTTTTKEPLQVPLDAEVPADHSTLAIPDVSPPAQKSPTTGDPSTQNPPIQPSSTDQQDRQDQQQLKQQQTQTGQNSEVKTEEDDTVIQRKVGNPHNQDATEPEPDVKTPDVPTLPQSPPSLPSPGSSKQQQTQQSQTQQSTTNPSGAKSEGEIGNASQSGQIAPPTTTTAAATEKKDDNAKETTTTTVAPTQEKSIVPTTTLQKGTKRPQSVGNKDGSSGTPLPFAFATLVTLAVITVALAF